MKNNHYRVEVWQDGEMVASVDGASRDRAIAEGHHYAMMYGQDGPVEVKLIQRPLITEE